MAADLVIRNRVSLQSRNTLALPGTAEQFCAVSTTAQLEAALDHARSQELAVTVLGGGSNVVIAGDIAGLVIAMAIPGRELLGDSDDSVVVRYGAGENWHDLVCHALDQNWFGLENLSLIPGCAGAAPIQNIGAYGVELKQSFVALDAMDIATGAKMRLDGGDCAFGYRDSIFKHELLNRVVITAVELRLEKVPAPNLGYPVLRQALEAEYGDLDTVTPRQVSDAVCAIRRSKLPDPASIANAGSFFKNPVVNAEQGAALAAALPDLPRYPQADGSVKLAAAWLIDRAGWKGSRHGHVGVHDQQALVLINRGGATGGELLDLARAIADNIQLRFGVSLEMEPRILGKVPSG